MSNGKYKTLRDGDQPISSARLRLLWSLDCETEIQTPHWLWKNRDCETFTTTQKKKKRDWEKREIWPKFCETFIFTETIRHPFKMQWTSTSSKLNNIMTTTCRKLKPWDSASHIVSDSSNLIQDLKIKTSILFFFSHD